MNEKIQIKGLNAEEISRELKKFGEPEFRGKQIYRQIYFRRTENFAKMTDLPIELRAKLEEHFRIQTAKELRTQKSIDGSVKFLFELPDGTKIESVLIPADGADRKSLCISTQAGCNVGCKFCATGTMGLNRNLSSGEIIDQFLQAEKIIGEKIDNIVLMGMGEPLVNYHNTLKALKILSDPENEIINRKRITLSTSGIVHRIYELAEDNPGVKLALSLHATTDEVREKLIPIAKKWPLSEVLEAVTHYYRSTSMPVTYEYIMLGGINDSPDDARRLVKISRRVVSRVNLIPYNSIDFTNPGHNIPLRRSNPETTEKFMKILKDAGIPVILRKTAGEDIDAACGQLALSEARK